MEQNARATYVFTRFAIIALGVPHLPMLAVIVLVTYVDSWRDDVCRSGSNDLYSYVGPWIGALGKYHIGCNNSFDMVGDTI